MNSFLTHLECTACNATYPSDQLIKTCPACGKVLYARYDLAAALVVLLWKVPEWQADRATDVRSPTARVALENELRRTLATVIAGAFVLFSGFVAWRNMRLLQGGRPPPGRARSPSGSRGPSSSSGPRTTAARRSWRCA